MDHKERLKRIERELAVLNLDSLIVTHLPNIRYLCGFTGSTGTLWVQHGSAVFFTDGRYTSQAREQVQGARVVITRNSPLLGGGDWIAGKTGREKHVLGIESEYMTVAAQHRLREILPKKVQIKQVSGVIEKHRVVKDADEMEATRKAVLAGAKLFKVLLETVRPGARESEVAAELEYAARKAGVEGMSFETIIASGRRSALPHGRASQDAIPANGFVVCDFGVILTGYCSDMTRTLYMGRANGEARSFYEAVRQAQLAAIAAVAPGIPIGEVDRAARRVLKRAGLGQYFTHSTGHGVGLEIHEAPRVAAGQSDLLRPGMVITIEPGAYVPDKWGVRIEDMVVVTDSGCEVLTPTSKELIAV